MSAVVARKSGVLVSVAAVSLVIGGCGSGPAADRSDGGARASEGQGGAAPSAEWDPADWTPPVAIQPVLTTEAEKEASYREALERRARSLGITDPPTVQRRDWSTSPVEVDERVSACLNEKGWDTTVGPLDGIEYQNIPASQKTAWSLANYECDAQHPLDPSIVQEWTPDQLNVVCTYWDEYYVPCMKDQGYMVDISERPSREAWAAAFNTPDRISRRPEYNLDRHVSEEQLAELEETCPQLPPSGALYGVAG